MTEHYSLKEIEQAKETLHFIRKDEPTDELSQKELEILQDPKNEA